MLAAAAAAAQTATAAAEPAARAARPPAAAAAALAAARVAAGAAAAARLAAQGRVRLRGQLQRRRVRRRRAAARSIPRAPARGKGLARADHGARGGGRGASGALKTATGDALCALGDYGVQFEALPGPAPPPSPSPPPPLAPGTAAAWHMDVHVEVLATAIAADGTIGDGAMRTALVNAVHAVQPSATVEFHPPQLPPPPPAQPPPLNPGFFTYNGNFYEYYGRRMEEDEEEVELEPVHRKLDANQAHGRWTIGAWGGDPAKSSCDYVCQIDGRYCDADDFANHLPEVEEPQDLINVINEARTRAVYIDDATGERLYHELPFGYDADDGSTDQTTCQDLDNPQSSTLFWDSADWWERAPRMLPANIGAENSNHYNSDAKCAVRSEQYDPYGYGFPYDMPGVDCSLDMGTTAMRRVCYCTNYDPPAPPAPPPVSHPGRWVIGLVGGDEEKTKCDYVCQADGRTCNGADFEARLTEVDTDAKLIAVINDARTRAVGINDATGEVEYGTVGFGFDADPAPYDPYDPFGFYTEHPEGHDEQTTCQGPTEDEGGGWGPFGAQTSARVRWPRMRPDVNDYSKCAVRPPNANDVRCDLGIPHNGDFRRVCWCTDPPSPPAPPPLAVLACGGNCNDAACASGEQQTLLYTITVLADHADDAAIAAAVEGGVAAYKAATGGDHLCSVGNYPSRFDPVHSPPPAPPPSPAPPPRFLPPSPPLPPHAPPPMTACNPATYVFYDGDQGTFITAGTTSYALNWWPSDRGPIAQPGGQTAEATSIEDAKSQCDAHVTCDAFAFHNPPTTAVGSGYGKHAWYGVMLMFQVRQTKYDGTLSQWFDSVTWSTDNPYAAGGNDFRYFWSIDECYVSGS